jgi:hypothetical protein
MDVQFVKGLGVLCWLKVMEKVRTAVQLPAPIEKLCCMELVLSFLVS